VNRVRTLLVAVNEMFLNAVADVVADDARIEVVGRAHSGSEALETVESLRAELVLVDVTLPDISGFEVVRRLKARPDAPLAVMLSFYDSRAEQLEAWSAGADGFVATSETADCLLPLVGDLLRQRNVGVRGSRPGISSTRVKPTDVAD
jgi:DNA-binding NarL/FixJ family response regulator